MNERAADEPVDIRYDDARGRLEISWADGAEGAYRYEFLRWRCPCAVCAGEMGIPGQLQFIDRLEPEQYRLQSIELVGLYALRPTWADGHGSGIFTFERLRALTEAAAADLEEHEQKERGGPTTSETSRAGNGSEVANPGSGPSPSGRAADDPDR